MKKITHFSWQKIPVYLFLILGSLLMIFPFIWMILTSFKTHAEAIMFPPKFWPASFSFVNYREAFSMAPFGKYFINSVIVMVLSVLTTTSTTILAAFAFSKMKFPGRSLIFSILLSLMMIPFEMLIITNYTTIVKIEGFAIGTIMRHRYIQFEAPSIRAE